jgi:ATP-binding cassette subfamily B protein
MRLCTQLEEIHHLERPEFLDRLTAVRGQGWAVVESAWSVLLTGLVGLRLLATLALLGGVDPYLLLLMPVAIGQIWLDQRGKRNLGRVEVAVADDMRLQRRLFAILTTPASGKEIRTTGAQDRLVRLQAEAWRRVTRARSRARAVTACWSAGGWLLFTAGYLAALYMMMSRNGTAGDVVLAVTAAGQLRIVVERAMQYSAQAAEASRVLDPFFWLRGYAATRLKENTGRVAPPARLDRGITIENLTFTYPGTDRPAVDGLTVRLPAGSVVAVVGEYGSGKTTLIKLLAKFYRPDSGRIMVDGTDLGDIDTERWWATTSAAFQDFGRYQTSFAEAVGLGNLDADRAALDDAVTAAAAGSLVARLPDGLATRLGKRFGGVELSEGQWQKVALARACVRRDPLLFVLDEPTASLDAPSEHDVFVRYIARSRTIGAATGAVTVIISHRYSTVVEADLILVMEQGRLVESGRHADLMSRGGRYAAAYDVQASAFAAAGRR